MAEPNCPKCGKPMVLRVARRGPNRGGQFYGCSDYPKCKATVPYPYEPTEDGQPPSGSAPKTGPALKERDSFPRVLRARPMHQNAEVRFFETAAVPGALLDRLVDEELSSTHQTAYSQWRMEYPARGRATSIDTASAQVLSVAEKILSRGRLTLASLEVENALRSSILCGSREAWEEFTWDGVLTGAVRGPEALTWFDSPVEAKFYREVLPAALGQDVTRWVTPQVEISSLLPNATADPRWGRVDFLLWRPGMANPVILEIDGQKHEDHSERDESRDRALEKHGYEVIRIPAGEVKSGALAEEARLRAAWARGEFAEPNDSLQDTFVRAVRLVHQVQLVLAHALRVGLLDIAQASSWTLSSDLADSGLLPPNLSEQVLGLAVADFLDFCRHLAQLYSTDILEGEPFFVDATDSSGNRLHISFTGELWSEHTVQVSPLSVPFHVANAGYAAPPAMLPDPSEAALTYFLRYIFRKDQFWEGQYEVVTRALQGKDAIVLLPTGAGKSIAFQLSALLLPGQTIVVDPIISLIEDQIDNLTRNGIDRCIGITGQLTPEAREQAVEQVGQGEYLFAYVTPERFQISEFRDALRTLTVHTPIAMVVIDEAHCVSEWGHDFRTAYLNLGRTAREYCRFGDHVPPLLALTGTASKAVLKDVQRELGVMDFDAVVTPKSFNRPELKFHVLACSSKEKRALLTGLLSRSLPEQFGTSPSTFFQPRGRSTYAGLVFCPHVNGDFGVVDVADALQAELHANVTYYSGTAPKYHNKFLWNRDKGYTAKQFKRNEVPLLVATKAFGMGIDKPNIRYSVHYGIPASLESFYQEAGRSGRDRREAHCYIILSSDDSTRNGHFLNPATGVEEVAKEIESIPWSENDDISRMLYFHTRAFKGVAAERDVVMKVLGELSDHSRKAERIVVFPGELEDAEKGLHRLLLLGIVRDYTIDYASQEFTIQVSGASRDDIIEAYGRYVDGYSTQRGQLERARAREFLSLPRGDFEGKMIETLLQFIYSIIEQGRRRALGEMLAAAVEGRKNDERLRERLLRYLEETEYSEFLDGLLQQPDGGIRQVMGAFERDIVSPREAAELRGQVSRYLESYPDHPGLLMLRSLTEMFARDRNQDIARQNFIASLTFGLRQYGVSAGDTFTFAAWALNRLLTRNKTLTKELTTEILEEFGEPELARKLVRELPPEVTESATWFLLANLTEHVEALLA